MVPFRGLSTSDYVTKTQRIHYITKLLVDIVWSNNVRSRPGYVLSTGLQCRISRAQLIMHIHAYIHVCPISTVIGWDDIWAWECIRHWEASDVMISLTATTCESKVVILLWQPCNWQVSGLAYETAHHCTVLVRVCTIQYMCGYISHVLCTHVHLYRLKIPTIFMVHVHIWDVCILIARCMLFVPSFTLALKMTKASGQDNVESCFLQAGLQRAPYFHHSGASRESQSSWESQYSWYNVLVRTTIGSTPSMIDC